MAKTREDFQNDEPVPLPDIPPFEAGQDTPLPNPSGMTESDATLPPIPPFEPDGFEFIQLPPPFEFEADGLESPKPVEAKDQTPDAPKPVAADDPFKGLPPIPAMEGGNVDLFAPDALPAKEWDYPTVPMQADNVPAKAESSPSGGIQQKLDSVLDQLARSLERANTGGSEQAIPDELAKQIETLNATLRELVKPPQQDRVPEQQPVNQATPEQRGGEASDLNDRQERMANDIEVIRDTLLRIVNIMDS